jgi:hypothetical protein
LYTTLETVEILVGVAQLHVVSEFKYFGVLIALL